MKTLFTTEAIFRGGRSGTINTPDGMPIATLGSPLEKGGEKRGPSPELVFAGAYSACFHGAVINAAKKPGTSIEDSTVRALVSPIENHQGGYGLGVEVHTRIPGLDRTKAQHIMDEAHKTCPCPRARRGGLSISWWTNP